MPVIQILIALLGLGLDIAAFATDIDALGKAGGNAIQKVLNVIGDGISILGDLGSDLSMLTSIFGWSGAQQAIDIVTLITNSLATAYKFISGFVNNGWAEFFGAAISATIDGVKTLFTGGIYGALDNTIPSIVQEGFTLILKKSAWKGALGGLTSIGQTVLSALQVSIDTCNSMTTAQYAASGC